jgi:hypothetical protein
MARIISVSPQGRTRDIAAQWLTLKAEITIVDQRAKRLRKSLLDIVENEGEPDSSGHRYFDFDEPIKIGEKTYSAIKREVRTSTYLDEEKAEERLREKGLYDEAVEVVKRLSQDRIYVLYQEDRLSDGDIEYMFTKSETYALKAA